MVSSSISEEVARATSVSPREVSFNTNFNLPDGLGSKDVDIHLSGELLADRAAQVIREQYGDVPQSIINAIKDRINYSVKSDQGKTSVKIPAHQLRMKAIKEAQKQATAIAQAQPQAEDMAMAEPMQIAMPEAIAIAIPQAQKQAIPNAQAKAQSYRNSLQQEVSQAMAYNDISIDAFFDKNSIYS